MPQRLGVHSLRVASKKLQTTVCTEPLTGLRYIPINDAVQSLYVANIRDSHIRISL